ncbi:MAG: serpin family protein [Candidatus Diapherotrites archaeon]
MKRKISFGCITAIAAIALLLFLAGCPQPEPVVPPADDAGATVQGVQSVANANNQFSFELYSRLKGSGGNVFFSPYSISVALAMTFEGAKGQTAEEMQAVMHFPEDSAVRQSSFAKIYNQINKSDKQYKLYTANALWAQQDYRFLEEYFNTVKNYYGGESTNLDFANETEQSRQTINSWVEGKTNSKIKDLLPAGSISPLTRLVLTNAIYFKGEWLKQFDKANTKEDDFRLSPGNTVKTQMMSLTGKEAEFNYAENDLMQVLELPYKGEELSMIILLPNNDNLNAAEESLTAEKLAEWKKDSRKQRVDVFIPKFTFTKEFGLADTLKQMGMPTAFIAGSADFSGMDGTNQLFISAVIHKAFVEVNEEGTEAAAATGIAVSGAMANPNPIPIFRADHPFIFLIQEKQTGTILFLGRVSDPSA